MIVTRDGVVASGHCAELVRIDGTRSEVAMDDKSFAQRAGQSSQDIMRGGVASDRADWDAQACQAASDAVTAPP